MQRTPLTREKTRDFEKALRWLLRPLALESPNVSKTVSGTSIRFVSQHSLGLLLITNLGKELPYVVNQEIGLF
jgi:hypothetical protein